MSGRQDANDDAAFVGSNVGDDAGKKSAKKRNAGFIEGFDQLLISTSECSPSKTINTASGPGLLSCQ
jgi:hypothetical protein